MGDDILGQIEDDLADLGGDAYDPTEEFGGCGCDHTNDDGPLTVSVEWPDVEPVERDLSPQEWGIRGEGLDADREQFAAMLNEGRLGSQPAEIHPTRPEQATGWDESGMGSVRSDQKKRGKHLFAHVAVSPGSMLRVEGQVGASKNGGTPKEFATNLEPKVNEYVEKFEAGDRPGAFFAYLDNDGALQGPQEGRHRAAAAMLAGLDVVPAVVLWETGGTFRRPSSIREGTEGYRADYPEGGRPGRL